MFDERAVKGIVIDPGHGGDDPGAVANGLKEKDLTLEISKYMYERFKELNVPVIITREGDTTLPPDLRSKKVLDSFGKDSNVIVLSNHINSGGGEGAEVIYALRNKDTLAKSILEGLGAEGQVMRKYYQRRLPDDPLQDYYYILRDTKPTEALLIEYGFIDNKNDVARLQKNIDKYAEAVVKAVTLYAGYPYRTPGGEEIKFYTVVKGDSLYSVASKLNTTVEELKKANNLTTNTLQIGQKLIIPSSNPTPPPTGGYINHTVKSGDSLYQLAKLYKTTVEDIIEANNLQTTVLQLGQNLKIPSTEEQPPSPPPVPPEEQIYIVQRGDSLYLIANKLNTTVEELKKINNLSSNTLQIGQKLIIPKGENQEPEYTKKYIVEKGDSLWNIAKKFNTTVDKIQSLNNLSTNALQIGQLLKIPIAEDKRVYVVTKGDSLYSIAQKFNTSSNAIRVENSLKSDVLQIGQRLVIPN